MKNFLSTLFMGLIVCNMVFANGESEKIRKIMQHESNLSYIAVIIVGIPLLMFAIWMIKSINKDENRLKESKINKIKKEKRPTEDEPSSSDIGARLKKLRQMHKDGILSKVEFEKAKNKLLK